jgi:hypothetical protein
MYKFELIEEKIKNLVCVAFLCDDDHCFYAVDFPYDKKWKIHLIDLINTLKITKPNTNKIIFKSSNTFINISPNEYLEIDEISIYDENGKKFFVDYSPVSDILNSF